MRRLAIVSSYDESCGNAAFAKVLKDSIETHEGNIQVDVIGLNLDVLQSTNDKVRKLGDAHIKEICVAMKGYDCINVQMEGGLYGSSPKDIFRRFCWIMASNKNVTVTMHSPRLFAGTIDTDKPYRKAFKQFLQLRFSAGIRALVNWKRVREHLELNDKILTASIRRQAKIIVHTSRAKKQISNLFKYNDVYVHPLKMVPYNLVTDRSVLDGIIHSLDIVGEIKTIGLFGYISSYKGHLDALEAIKRLPYNYKLLIFGRQHPQTIKPTGKVDDYLKVLMAFIEKNKLAEKVFFVGELNDRDFMDVVSAVDVAWLPYYENGQDGSGIASICLDLNPRVLCSASFAFDELFRLIPYNNVLRFDIGNYIELASKTIQIINMRPPCKPYSTDAAYDIKTQASLYAQFV